jgi:hypothetical protein
MHLFLILRATVKLKEPMQKSSWVSRLAHLMA